MDKWIKELQQENSLLSRLRLKAIYNYSHVLKSKYENKQLVSKFWSRNRDLWNEEDIKKFDQQSYEHNTSLHDENTYDQYAFEITHLKLPAKAQQYVLAQTTYCNLQEKTLQSFFINTNEEINTLPALNEPILNATNSSICWKPNATIQTKDDIKTIYINILQSENFHTNEIQQQCNINTTNIGQL